MVNAPGANALDEGADRASDAASRSRPDRWRLLALAILALFGSILVANNQNLTVFEDEATGIAAAGTTGALETIAVFIGGGGTPEHPPLYDLVLHAWMRFTESARPLLRVPSILFYCLALWMVGATAQRLWGARLLAVLIGVAWPAGYFLGTPAHWSSLAMLCVAGVTWSYVGWRESGRSRALVAFSLFGIALVYTNYLGWAILFALGAHLLLSRPGSRALKQALVAGAAILVGFLPLLRALVYEVGEAGTRADPSFAQVLASGLYHGYSLLVSEAVAPWCWPAAVAALGIGGLVYVSARTPQPRWILGILAVVFVPALLFGILNGRRLGLFGPWLLLYLTGLLACTRLRKVALVAVLLVFVTGWAGVVSKRWSGTFRYIEPWEEIAARAVALSAPGDLIICDHPSFYFYAHYELGWDGWRETFPQDVVKRSERYFSRLETWRDAVVSRDRILYLRTVVMPWVLEEQESLSEFLSQNYRLVTEVRYLEDNGWALKNRFLPNQPRWRIEMRKYERKEGGAGSSS